MLPSKLKRKIADVKTISKGKDKTTSIGKDKEDKENVEEAQSDYESDEVNFVTLHMCFFLFTSFVCRKIFLPKFKMLTAQTKRMSTMKVMSMNQIQLTI